MADAYSIDGTLWPLLLGIAGFATTFLGRMLGLFQTDASVERFSKWVAILFGIMAGYAMDTASSNSWIDLCGRLGVGGMVFFASSLFLTLGALMGQERAVKKRR